MLTPLYLHKINSLASRARMYFLMSDKVPDMPERVEEAHKLCERLVELRDYNGDNLWERKASEYWRNVLSHNSRMAKAFANVDDVKEGIEGILAGEVDLESKKQEYHEFFKGCNQALLTYLHFMEMYQPGNDIFFTK